MIGVSVIAVWSIAVGAIGRAMAIAFPNIGSATHGPGILIIVAGLIPAGAVGTVHHTVAPSSRAFASLRRK
jgi:hypothetical protein